MNSTPLNRNSDHDPLPQINLQEYGDPELFVEECKSKGGIDRNFSISVGLNENTFKSSLSTDLRMFDSLETKDNIRQPEIISSVDLLDMNYDTKVHTIDYLKSLMDDRLLVMHLFCLQLRYKSVTQKLRRQKRKRGN